MELFGSSGTRGIVNERLTPEFVVGVTAAAGSVLAGDRFAVARDTRLTGRMLENAAVSGITSVGVNVYRLGVAPTPAVQSFARDLGMPAVILTASHNPPEYNGIKLIDSRGIELSTAELEKIESVVRDDEQQLVPWNRIGFDRRDHRAIARYVDEIVNAVDRERIGSAELTVALDPGHGAAAATSPEILRQLGCQVVTVNGQIDGHFPGRNPEPVRRNLSDLKRLVRTSNADLGIAHDGDGDRAIFVDERGKYIEGDASLAVLASAVIEEGDVAVSAINVSQRLVDVVAKAGGSLVLTPIGSTHIITRIQRLQATGDTVPIAGEGNGGMYIPPIALRRDGALVGARFLELLAESDRSPSELISPFDDYENVRYNVPYRDISERATMLAAVENFAETSNPDIELTRIDGIRFDYGDAWVLARPSGTEPLIRIYAEGRTQERTQEIADMIYLAISEAKENG